MSSNFPDIPVELIWGAACQALRLISAIAKQEAKKALVELDEIGVLNL